MKASSALPHLNNSCCQKFITNSGYRGKTFWKILVKNNTNPGFTLLEILVTIIISAILAVILVQVMTNQPWRSFQSVDAFNRNLALKSAMENISADFKRLQSENHPAPLMALQSNLNGDGGFPGYWDATETITATHYCLDLTAVAPAVLEENNPHGDCTISDTILKITLESGNQGIRALFTR